MITFAKKAEPHPSPDKSEQNRFEQIRKVASEKHRKAEADGARRRAGQTADDNTLI